MTTIKFCGLRREEDILAVNGIHPDYAGMILSAGYKRSVDREQAKRLKTLLDPGIAMCGVFVNEDVEYIASFVTEGIIDVIQLHGSEEDQMVQELKERFPKVPVIKAFIIHNEEDVQKALSSSADRILLDGGAGEGRRVRLSLLKDVNREYMLAGGLDAENVSEAIRFLHPYGVDTSSGIETDHRKDPKKMKAFAKAVRKEDSHA
ncbi:MAG: phosphoribosylanthranilate isomerase [Solobacterium sp.]|nr:phosphoribosylanthranilate isomerase [Solobacterium sp.]